MNILQTSSTIQQNISVSGIDKSSAFSNVQRLSFENIRVLRQHFEQGTSPLRSVLGDDQHQTMMVAMYEGTEKLLNQDVSEFAVLEYLEGLKLTARNYASRVFPEISSEAHCLNILLQLCVI